MEDDYEECYCSNCDCNVQAWSTCSYGVGQHGGIVIATTFCTVCQKIIAERLIDKDI